MKEKDESSHTRRQPKDSTLYARCDIATGFYIDQSNKIETTGR